MIRKLFRYLLPLLLLPLLSSYASVLTTQTAAMLGTDAVVSYSAVNAVTSLCNTPLYLLAMIGLVCAAMLAENGRLHSARSLLWVFWALFLGITVAMGLLFLVNPGAMMRLYSYAPEVLAYGTSMLKSFAGVVLVMAVVCTLAALFIRRYSMTVTLIAGIVLLAAGSVIMPMRVLQGYMAADGIGFGLGIQFAAVRILPFLLIPVDRFCRELEQKPAVEF